MIKIKRDILSKPIESEYCMVCSIKPGAFSREYQIRFLCYNEKGELTEGCATIYEDHIDEKKDLSRVDLIDIHNQTAEIQLVENGTFDHLKFKIPLESLVRIMK